MPQNNSAALGFEENFHVHFLPGEKMMRIAARRPRVDDVMFDVMKNYPWKNRKIQGNQTNKQSNSLYC